MLTEDEYNRYSDLPADEKRELLKREMAEWDREFATLKRQIPGFTSEQWCEWIKRRTGSIQLC
jgi:hypothetical protein